MDELSEKFLEKWSALAEKLGLDTTQSEEVGHYLLAQYSGEDRHYHNVRHITSMLNGFESLKDKFKEPLAAELAIFFHDVIYDAASKENEEQSALKMKELLSGIVSDDILDSAAFSIEATKKHAATDNPDTNLILDLDMAILGQPWAVYERYAKGVMQEYLPVYPEAAYRQGRANLFLEPTIAHGNIFLTPEFQHLNEPATKNMLKEKDILVSGQAFGGKGYV